jgi:hypothetical protein
MYTMHGTFMFSLLNISTIHTLNRGIEGVEVTVRPSPAIGITYTFT